MTTTATTAPAISYDRACAIAAGLGFTSSNPAGPVTAARPTTWILTGLSGFPLTQHGVFASEGEAQRHADLIDPSGSYTYVRRGTAPTCGCPATRPCDGLPGDTCPNL